MSLTVGSGSAAAVFEEARRELELRRGDLIAAAGPALDDPSERGPEDFLLIESIREIDAALARIDAGTYGHCTECDRAIGPDRLEALPAAALCMSCQVGHSAR